MGKKYIIELGRCERLYKAFIDGIGKPELAWLSPEIDLTPYTEPDLERVKEEAYLKGLNDGKGVILESTQNNAFNNGYKKCLEDMEQVRKEAYEAGAKSNAIVIADDKAHEAYQRGLADAWEAAKKIASDDAGQNHVIFGQHFANVIFNTFTASEAIEKIRQYEQEQEEIKVGDEVKTEDGMKMVIAALINKDFAGLGDDGRFMFGELDGTITRTGRHFPEIAAVLEKMRGEQE